MERGNGVFTKHKHGVDAVRPQRVLWAPSLGFCPVPSMPSSPCCAVFCLISGVVFIWRCVEEVSLALGLQAGDLESVSKGESRSQRQTPC